MILFQSGQLGPRAGLPWPNCPVLLRRTVGSRTVAGPNCPGPKISRTFQYCKYLQCRKFFQPYKYLKCHMYLQLHEYLKLCKCLHLLIFWNFLDAHSIFNFGISDLIFWDFFRSLFQFSPTLLQNQSQSKFWSLYSSFSCRISLSTTIYWNDNVNIHSS